MKLVIYYSKSGNTKKVAEAIAKIIRGKALEVSKVKEKDLDKYDLIGFGAGIYAFRPHKKLLDFVKGLGEFKGKNAFIFSTSGFGKGQTGALRGLLKDRGFKIVNEFSCKGQDDFFISRLFKANNKGRPNKEDLEKAKEFGKKLKS